MSSGIFQTLQQSYAHPHGTMAYYDVGSGPVILCIHGTPTWSILWRHAFMHLQSRCRVIAVDHLGFGASDKPHDADYSLHAHATRLADFVTHLHLRDIVLVAHDYGVPIGCAALIQDQQRYGGLVLLNGFCWPFRGEFAIPRAARLLHSRVGRYLYLQHNLSPRWLLPNVFGTKACLDPDIHRSYLAPFATPDQRWALWACVEELEHATDWLNSLWTHHALLAALPAALVWGAKDPVYGMHFLHRWRQALPHASVTVVEHAGHFIQEEAPQAYIAAIVQLLEQRPLSASN